MDIEAIPAAFRAAYPGDSSACKEYPYTVEHCEDHPDCIILEFDDLQQNPHMSWLDPMELLGELAADHEITGDGGKKRYLISIKDTRLLVTVLLGILEALGDKAAKEVKELIT